jgi:RNA polymerase sigma-70 factor, ECF subfamily
MSAAQDDITASRLTLPDQELMRRLRAGDDRAVTDLESRYGRELRLFCSRMLNDTGQGEDVVQDVFCTCCQLAPESLPQHSIRGWLYQIARRRCIDLRRKRHETAPPGARAVRRAQPSLDQAIDPLTTPSGKALKAERAKRLLTLLDDLDEELRDVVIMRYFQDLPREEISEAIGLSLAGTKARLSKAMQMLRDKLGVTDESGS